MEKWLELIENNIEKSTYSAYRYTIDNRIKPYFNNLDIKLINLTAIDISTFYSYCLNYVKTNTVKHYHMLIHQALRFAFENDLISSNIAKKVRLSKV